MSFVIYNKETTRRFQIPASSVGCYTDSWATAGSAKGILTRQEKKDSEFDRDLYAIAEIGEFITNIEKTETVINLMSGKEVQQSVNTPLCLDVSCETYWSM